MIMDHSVIKEEPIEKENSVKGDGIEELIEDGNSSPS